MPDSDGDPKGGDARHQRPKDDGEQGHAPDGRLAPVASDRADDRQHESSDSDRDGHARGRAEGRARLSVPGGDDMHHEHGRAESPAGEPPRLGRSE